MASMARSLEIADLLAVGLERFLRARLPGTIVVRTYTPFVSDDSFAAALANSKAMLVFVVPLKKTTELETRSEDAGLYEYRIVFAEKYTGTTVPPPNSWMDIRVSTVDAAEEQFGDARNAFETENGQLWAQASEIAMIFDAEAHAEQGTFWSVWDLTLKEIA